MVSNDFGFIYIDLYKLHVVSYRFIWCVLLSLNNMFVFVDLGSLKLDKIFFDNTIMIDAIIKNFELLSEI